MDREKLILEAEKRAETFSCFGDFTGPELASISTFSVLSESVGGIDALFSGDFPEEQAVATEVLASEEFGKAKEKILAVTTRGDDL